MFYQAKRSRRLAICRGTPMLLCTLLLANACSSGSAKAGLGPSENLAPSIVSLELQVAQRVHGTDESVVIRSKGRLSDGGLVSEPTDWESLDGGDVTAVGDASIALFAPSDTGSYRIVGRGRGRGQGNGNGNGNGNGGGDGEIEPTAPIVDTVTVVVAEVESPIVSLTVSPIEALVVMNTTRVFTITGLRADGTPATPAADWSTTGGGTIVDVGAGAEYRAGSSEGTWEVSASLDGGLAAAAVVEVTDAWFAEDFSAYESTEDLLSSASSFTTYEDFNRTRISLDRSVFFPGSQASMRYDFPAGSAGNCSNYSIGREINLASRTSNPIREIWGEIAVRFQAGWHTKPVGYDCTNGASDHKLIRFYTDASTYFGLKDGHFGTWWNFGAPYSSGVNAARHDEQSNRTSAQDWDGEWHVLRFHLRLSSTPTANDGVVHWEIDGVPLLDGNGDWNPEAVATGSASAITRLRLGANMNHLVESPQSMWFGPIQLYRDNPGW